MKLNIEHKYWDKRDYLKYISLGVKYLLLTPVIPLYIICGIGCWFSEWYRELIDKITNWY